MTKAATKIQQADHIEGIIFVDYKNESQLDSVMSMVGRDLSEPYSIFTYRYFLERFPHLCILACPVGKPGEPIGCVVGKIDFSNITELEQQEHEAATILAAAGNAEGEGQCSTSAVPSIEKTGYIGMLAVMASHRRMGIGTSLVTQVLRRMRSKGCSSVTLETEVSNGAAQRLYQDEFGFIREELLVRYYLNWGDAYRLRLWFTCESEKEENARITQ